MLYLYLYIIGLIILTPFFLVSVVYLAKFTNEKIDLFRFKVFTVVYMFITLLLWPLFLFLLGITIPEKKKKVEDSE